MNSQDRETGLVVVTHGQIGRTMIEVAEFILGQSLASINFVSFRQSAVDKTSDDEIKTAIDRVDRGRGVLVMSDLGGASPNNYVRKLLTDNPVALVSGINMAMLIRVWNYRRTPLPELVQLATEGAIRDIRECKK